MAGRDLARRLGVAAVGIPLVIAVAYLGGWVLAGVIAVLSAIGTYEVYRLAHQRGWRPFNGLGIAASASLVLVAAWSGSVQVWSVVAVGMIMVVTLVSLVAAVFRRGPEGAPLMAASITVFGVLYVGATLSFAVHLRAFPGFGDGGVGWLGALLLIFPFAVTWCGDSGAYFVGHRWGRRKLLPAVSPGKTVAGGVGGLLGAVGGAVFLAWMFLDSGQGPGLPVAAAAGLGLVLGVVAQLADLSESLLKREAGVKDSGSLLPGHGGVLDRFDAVLFNLPLTYALLPFLIR